MSFVTYDELREDVEKLFAPASDSGGRESKSIGAELEMIPVYRSTGKRVLAQSGHPSGSEFVASLGTELGWAEELMQPDPSCWNFEDGRITFEPGGQIEFSSAVFPTARELLNATEKWHSHFSAGAERVGIQLKSAGIEDRSPIEDVPLQLHRQRYAEMTRYFNSLGEFGVVMMRQTASLQINVDRGENPMERWRLLNALAPYLIAIFANSPRYAGSETGHASYRAHVWRMLDPLRTGLRYRGEDPVGGYLDFALDAPVILGSNSDSFYPPFRHLLSEGVTKEVWDVHLSTLFPEIRPRQYFEIRSVDALDPHHVCAAVAFVCGIVYSEFSTNAMQLIGEPDSSLLVRAGKSGLGDSAIRETAMSLVSLALSGCQSLGSDYFSHSQIEQASEFFRAYTAVGRSPSDSQG